MEQKQTVQEKTPVKQSLQQILVQLILAAALIGGSIIIASYYLKTPPRAKPGIKKNKIPLVQTTRPAIESPHYTTQAMGTVVESRVISLSPLVGGEIIKIHPDLTPGGFFNEQETLAILDPVDFELSLFQLQSEAAKARSTLSIEMGNQKIAFREFEILDQKVRPEEKHLMLRQPQLETAKANLAAAEARVRQAQLNLARTKIKAPFNGVVLSKSIDLGSKVTTNSSIAKIAGTDKFQVRFTLPTKALPWLTIPGDSSNTGSKIKIYLSEKEAASNYREGRITRLEAAVDQGGKMAVLYATVKDPLCLCEENKDKPKLLLGSFVRMDITGKQLQDVTVIARDHLRENNTIWVLTDDSTLRIQPVEIITQTKDKLYVNAALHPGESIITTSLNAPLEGMQLQLKADKKQDTPPKDEENVKKQEEIP